MKERERYVIV
uniref:Uncharacterized protein n=1 Tax=Lepeophtheirus salmonis TaxID=72036 RepID=A0A0K2UL89_LEPSM